MKLQDIAANSSNPRKISEAELAMLKQSMDEFGDLSGLVHNLSDDTWIGGHQRNKNIPQDAEIVIRQQYDPPTRTGTVSEGHVVIAGEKWNYRAVLWDEHKAKAAMISANKQGGKWEYPVLAELLLELDNHNYNMESVGFDEKELEKTLAYSADYLAADSDLEEEKEEESPDDSTRHASSQVRMVQLFFNEQTHVEFLAKTQSLLSFYGADNLTDLVLEVVREAHRSHQQD